MLSLIDCHAHLADAEFKKVTVFLYLLNLDIDYFQHLCIILVDR